MTEFIRIDSITEEQCSEHFRQLLGEEDEDNIEQNTNETHSAVLIWENRKRSYNNEWKSKKLEKYPILLRKIIK